VRVNAELNWKERKKNGGTGMEVKNDQVNERAVEEKREFTATPFARPDIQMKRG